MKKPQIIKPCKICGFPKPLKEFVIHRNYADKHSDVCLECNRKKQRGFNTLVLESLKRIEDKLK
jgi:hypothetical protein